MKPALIPILFLVSLARAQSPAASAPLEPGVIEGKVVSVSGEPLLKAALHLQSSSGGTNYLVSTDARGGFLFEAILPGRYRLLAEHAGYIQQFYGERVASSGGGRNITLLPGGHLESLVVTLTPQAAISGRILDEDGDAISGAVVFANRIGYSGGKKQALSQVAGYSNPDGSFTIWNLPPGRYYLSAVDQRRKIFPDEQPAGGTAVVSHLTTYFPNAADESGATPIAVGAGADVRGLDLRLIPGRKHSLRGKLTGLPERGAFPGLNLVLNSKAGTANQEPAILRPDGTFAFAEVTPGDYILTAQTARGGPVPLQAYLPVTVSDHDLEVELPLTPAAEIAGAVKMLQNDVAANVTGQPAVFLINSESPAASQSAENTDASGSFRVRGILAARYRVALPNLPRGVLVKSIRFEGQDITHDFLDLTSGAGGNLEIVLSPTAADLTGVVHNEDGAVIADATVAIWKAGETPGGFSDSPDEVRTDATGQFQFQNLSPGEYLVGAWENLEPGLTQVPEFRSAFESSAVKVQLEESGHSNLDVKLFSQSSVAPALAKLP